MQFSKDIFISYAHIDDESLMEDKKGWIAEFHRSLEIRLGQLMGVKPNIWRDPALQGNHLFGDEIVDQFSDVAVMISIVSPRYIKSEWCQKEIKGFYEVCNRNTGFTIKNKARVFKVIKTPVPAHDHPESIRDILGYEFYASDPVSGRTREFSPFFGTADRSYWEKLDDLANDIAAFLQEIKAAEGGPVQQLTNANDKRKVKSIFLSESSYDTLSLRDSLKRELQAYGYNILPMTQLPLVGPILTENVNVAMKEAQLSIHLVGNNYGVVPEGTDKSIVELQNEIAASESLHGRLTRLIWIPENTDPADERQRIFLQKLTAGYKDAIAGADMVKGSLENFKNVVHDKLRAMESTPAETEKREDAGGRKMIYLICDMQDLDIVRPLEDYLFNVGIEVMLPIFDGDETQIREDHIENLKNCSGAIIFYGFGNEIWLRTKMRDFLKINGYGRTNPLLFKSVYIAQPLSPAKQRFRTLEAEVLNGADKVPENELKGLLSKL